MEHSYFFNLLQEILNENNDNDIRELVAVHFMKTFVENTEITKNSSNSNSTIIIQENPNNLYVQDLLQITLINVKNSNNKIGFIENLIKKFEEIQNKMIANNEIYKNEKNIKDQIEKKCQIIENIFNFIEIQKNLNKKYSFIELIKKHLVILNNQLKIVKKEVKIIFEGQVFNFSSKNPKQINDSDLEELKDEEYEEIFFKTINFLEINKLNLQQSLNELKKNKKKEAMLPNLELEQVLSESYQFFSKNVEKIERMPSLIFCNIRRCKQLYEKRITEFERKGTILNYDTFQILYLLYLLSKLQNIENIKLYENLKKQAKIPFYENFPIKISKEIKEKIILLSKQIKIISSKYDEAVLRRKNINFKNLYWKKCKKLEAKICSLKKSQKTLYRNLEFMDSFREYEVKFSFLYEDVKEFLSSSNAILKKNDRKPLIYHDLFLKCGDKVHELEILKKSFGNLVLLKDCSEIVIEKIGKLNNQIYELIDRLVVFLQKGCEENDQICLEYIGESEKIINEINTHLSNYFINSILTNIDFNHDQFLYITKENSKLHSIAKNIINFLHNVTRESYSCSSILKKKAAYKFQSLKSLTYLLESFALSIESNEYFNLNLLSMVTKYKMGLKKIDFEKKIEIKNINSKIKEHVEQMENRLDSQSFSEKNLTCYTSRINLEHYFLDFFDKIEAINEQVNEVVSKLAEKNFNIILFDEEYESNIKRIIQFEEEIESTCKKLKEIDDFKEILALLINDWIDLLFKMLRFNPKNIAKFAQKIGFINQLTLVWKNIKKEINLFALNAEKTNKKKKQKYFIQEDLILKFSNLIEDFRGMITEAKFSKRTIEIQSKQFFVDQIVNMEKLNTIISEYSMYESILSLSLKIMKEISEEENEIVLNLDQFNTLQTENEEENTEESLTRFKYKEFVKGKLEDFQNTIGDNEEIRELGVKLKKLMLNCVAG